MNNQDIFQIVVERLKSEPFLNGFKFRKRDYSFIQQENGLRRSIELDHWIKDGVLIVYPIYMVRFDVLLKWLNRIASNPCKSSEIILPSILAEICLGNKISFRL